MKLTQTHLPVLYTPYRNDHFIKHILKKHPYRRTHLCRLILNDATIKNVSVLNVERDVYRSGGKAAFNDFVGRINKKTIVNIEMQTNGIYSEEYDRFRAYAMFLATENFYRGKQYHYADEIIQIIINTSGSLKTLNHYRHDLAVVDEKYLYVIRKDKIRTIIFNTKHLKEETDMSKELDELEQFMYLMEHDEFHSQSTPTKMMNMIAEEHGLYLGTIEQRLGFYADLVDAAYQRDVAKRNEREGMKKGLQEGLQEGKEKGQKLQALILAHKLLLKMYNVNLKSKLEKCNLNQLNRIYDLCLNDASLEEIMTIIED